MVDLSGLPVEKREEEVQRYAEARSQRPIDLSKGPLASVEVLRLSADEHVVLIGMHHIIYDGWSMAVLDGELSTAYRAFAAGLPSPLPELPIQYADFAVWQRERLQGEVLEGLRRYWRRTVKRPPQPGIAGRSAADSGTGGAEREPRCHLPRSLSEAIARLSRQERATPFMTLPAAFQTLLHRYSGQDDFPSAFPSPAARGPKRRT